VEIAYKHPDLTAKTIARTNRDMPLPVQRWLILGVVSFMLIVLALSRAGVVGAAAPANCIPVNYTTCMSNGVYYSNGNPTTSVATTYIVPYSYGVPYAYTAPYAYVAPYASLAPNTASSGYPTNTVVSTYYDPRYGVVSVVTDASGNLIDINTATGQRIYPIYPDYGYGSGYVNGNYTAGCAPGNYSCISASPYAYGLFGR
jgi:hypothetical protein